MGSQMMPIDSRQTIGQQVVRTICVLPRLAMFRIKSTQSFLVIHLLIGDFMGDSHHSRQFTVRGSLLYMTVVAAACGMMVMGQQSYVMAALLGVPGFALLVASIGWAFGFCVQGKSGARLWAYIAVIAVLTYILAAQRTATK